VNVAVNVPPETAQVGLEIDPESDSEQAVSPGENPEPETEIVVPTWADVGLRAMATGRIVTWKFAVAFPVSAPFVCAVTRYEPAATLATLNVAVRLPPAIEQLWDKIAVLASEHEVSVV
jgi:hypothetical protein